MSDRPYCLCHGHAHDPTCALCARARNVAAAERVAVACVCPHRAGCTWTEATRKCAPTACPHRATCAMTDWMAARRNGVVSVEEVASR